MSDLPEDVAHAIEESKLILDAQQQATNERMEFLYAISQCLNEIVKPAAEEFAVQFENTQLKLKIDGPGYALTPHLTITAELETLLREPSFSVGFRYQPTEKNEGLQFLTHPHDGEDWTPLNTISLSKASREGVLSTLAKMLALHLKRRFALKQGS